MSSEASIGGGSGVHGEVDVAYAAYAASLLPLPATTAFAALSVAEQKRRDEDAALDAAYEAQ